jgi:hypothetical protein
MARGTRGGIFTSGARGVVHGDHGVHRAGEQVPPLARAEGHRSKTRPSIHVPTIVYNCRPPYALTSVCRAAGPYRSLLSSSRRQSRAGIARHVIGCRST